jgi:hypothetical protein
MRARSLGVVGACLASLLVVACGGGDDSSNGGTGGSAAGGGGSGTGGSTGGSTGTGGGGTGGSGNTEAGTGGSDVREGGSGADAQSCETACDCEPGDACFDGHCTHQYHGEMYCCPTQCDTHLGKLCQSPNGNYDVCGGTDAPRPMCSFFDCVGNASCPPTCTTCASDACGE